MQTDPIKRKISRKRLWAVILAACLLFTTLAVERIGAALATTSGASDANAAPVCGETEHAHNADCYESRSVLTCELEEGEEHAHTDACYETESFLTCALAEHSHTESCYLKNENDTESAAEQASVEGDTEENDEETDASAQIDSANAPYHMEVTFDGQPLSEGDAENVISDTWSANEIKTMTVTLTRDSSVAVEASAKYLLCMKVTDLFYFMGLPDCADINGAENAVVVQNAVPQVYKSNGTQSALASFSAYSGEIRVLLNPTVDTITFNGIDVRFNPELSGYSNGVVPVSDPVRVSLVRVDSDRDIGALTDGDKTELRRCQVDQVSLKTDATVGGFRNGISTDGFITAGLHEQNLSLSKVNGRLAYGCAMTGQAMQVYKTLTAVYHCPYITVDGQKYYLDFSTDDTALTSNKQGNYSAYHMAEPAVYDEEAHTITYRFENIYLGGFNVVFYTPVFTWPSEIQDYEIPAGVTYKVEGSNWELTEQTCTTGANASSTASMKPGNYAYYAAELPNVAMVSSNEADPSLRIAKREIYQGVTRESGVPGVLGFFDIHNDGAADTPLLDVTFDFNTDDHSDAVYYVTQVRLPVYGKTGEGKLTYTLTSDRGNQDVTGQIALRTVSYNVSVSDLRNNSGVGDDYYIASLSYQTQLQKSTKYHIETAHLNRNRVNDCGLFWGYLEQKESTGSALGKSACARMTIASADGTSAITTTATDQKTEISSIEKSTIADRDYIAFSLSKPTLDDAYTRSVTAGNTVNLKFSATLSAEEYACSGTNSVNGYHTLRDGSFYICLPDDVSIPGKEQVTISVGQRSVSAQSVTRLSDGACTVNGVSASWWEIKASGINATATQSVNVKVALATSSTMDGVSWNFQNCVSVYPDNQAISWSAAVKNHTIYSKVVNLQNSSSASVKALGNYLAKQNPDADRFGISMHSDGSTSLTIVRAEAKLDVDTDLYVDGAASSNRQQLSGADSLAHYDVVISSTDGGSATDFNYYIPIVSTSSALDSFAMVSQNEYSLALKQAVEIINETEGGGNNPFLVYYTTDPGLTSSTVQSDSVKWMLKDDVADFGSVTAVRITTSHTENAAVDDGEMFRFRLDLGFAGSDFEQLAGCVAQWRSFGRYTYNRNGASTTNTYPSGSNSLTIRYDCDMTEEPSIVQINTADNPSLEAISASFPTTFQKAQDLKVTNVKAANVTLINGTPDGFTGTDANEQFRMAFNVSNGNAILLQSGSSGGSWTTAAGEPATLQAEVDFSPNLTETAMNRYVDITLSNDVVNIVWRVKLVRTVAAAKADGSGVKEGAHYQVPSVEDSSVITQNSAFSALFVMDGFNSSNYPVRCLTWQDENGAAVNFPQGTDITLMQVDGESKVTDYWYYRADGKTARVDLASFTRMGGTDSFSYGDARGTEDFRYLFVIDFAGADAPTGEYRIGFDADVVSEGTAAFEAVAFPVTLTAKTTYSLNSASDAASQTPAADVSCTVTRSGGDDNYRAGKSLALVLDGGSLPADARIMMGDTMYDRNSMGKFILPLDNAQDGENTVTLELISDMFPDAAASYAVNGQLYLVDSSHAAAPMAGSVMDETVVTFEKVAAVKPAMKITGVRVGSVESWTQGQTMNFVVKNLPSDAVVTVTAYSGVSGGQKVTDLLSSVGGQFVINNGMGTYDASKTSSGKLVLSSAAKAGTYRLVFDVTVDGQSVLTVPYYVVAY